MTLENILKHVLAMNPGRRKQARVHGQRLGGLGQRGKLRAHHRLVDTEIGNRAGDIGVTGGRKPRGLCIGIRPRAIDVFQHENLIRRRIAGKQIRALDEILADLNVVDEPTHG